MNLQMLPAVVKRQIATADLPPSYEKAKSALAECAHIDECKEWINRMAAMASYARQAKDIAMEELAIRIRRRAERRLGELLAEIPVPKRGDSAVNHRKRASESIGLTQPLSSQLVRVASVPKPIFDAKVERSPPPSLKQLDPGWSAKLASRVNGGAEAIAVYSDLQNALAPLNRMVYEKKVDAASLAEQIRQLNLPEEYLRGLKSSALMISEWLDRFEEHLSK